jgi:WD40 repeat protein
MKPRYCAACGLDCIARKYRQSPEDEYVLVGTDSDNVKKFHYHLKKAVKNFNLTWQQLDGDFNLTVCRWVEEVKRSRIVFFHSKAGDTRHSGIDNATTMVRTGIAIGLGVAWRMILEGDDDMPTDLKGYKYVSWDRSPRIFEATLNAAVRTLLGEARPYGGMYDPLVPIEAVKEDLDIVVEDGLAERIPGASVPSSLDRYVLITYHPENDNASKFAFMLNDKFKLDNVATWLDQERSEDWIGQDWQSAISQVILKSSALIAVYTDEQARELNFRHETEEATAWGIPVILVLPGQAEESEPIPTHIQSTADYIIDATKSSDWYEQILQHIRDSYPSMQLGIAIKQLTDQRRNLFQQLGVFVEDADIPVSTIASLWQLDQEDVEEILYQLNQQSLLSLKDDHIRIHEHVRNSLIEESDKIVHKVKGTGGILSIAKCCNPEPGDEIIGYLTRGRGVKIHRPNCPNILSIAEQERLIEVSWESTHDERNYEIPNEAQLHRRILDAWNNLYSLPNEYAWRYYIYHAANAGRTDQAKELLQDVRWLKAKLDATDVDALLADYALFPDDTELSRFRRLIEANRSSLEDIFDPKGFIQRTASSNGALFALLLANAIEIKSHQGQSLAKLSGHTNDVTDVIWSSSGKTLVTASEDHTVRIWNTETWLPLSVLMGHTAPVVGILEMPDGRLLSWSTDSTLRIWSEGGETLAVLTGHTAAVTNAEVLEDGRIKSTDSNGAELIWSSDGRLEEDNEAIPYIRVFLACAADVRTECKIAADVIDNFPNRSAYQDQVAFRVVSWDSAEGDSDITPQEAKNRGLPKPSECDIVVAIFWSRMGTPIIVDGIEYLSGTHWELMDALGSPRPKTIIFRRMEQPRIDVSDPQATSRIEQYRQVEESFKSEVFYDEDGKILRGINTYRSVDDFRRNFEIIFEKIVVLILVKMNNQK